jgi:hypothetical protein
MKTKYIEKKSRYYRYKCIIIITINEMKIALSQEAVKIYVNIYKSNNL